MSREMKCLQKSTVKRTSAISMRLFPIALAMSDAVRDTKTLTRSCYSLNFSKFEPYLSKRFHANDCAITTRKKGYVLKTYLSIEIWQV
jgi:hypothetical protein